MSNEIQAEFSVIGALLIDNDSIDRIPDLQPEHFYNFENKLFYTEICKQIAMGKRVDVITVFDSLKNKVTDCLVTLNSIAQSVGSSANISRYAEIIVDRAIKRALVSIAGEIEGIAASHEKSDVCVDLVASKVEQLAQKKTTSEPQRLNDMLGNYVGVMEDRMSGTIKPLSTGFADLDIRLGGGADRGSVVVVAGRPAMGKTAFGLAIARNVSISGASLFLSMEMAKEQVIDRNIAALGQVPLSWLRVPKNNSPTEKNYWDNMTKAFLDAQDLNLYIDDQTGLNMLAIRNKARQVKRKNGLDCLVVDQLSFITGGTADKPWDKVGEYTRGLLQIAKELNIVVVLLCQLNRECEKRNDKRPMLSDLAQSGSIEQDAATILFLYRDEVYNQDSPDKGICEVIVAKQRQGATGHVGLNYQGEYTRFNDLARHWERNEHKHEPRRRGLAADL